ALAQQQPRHVPGRYHPQGIAERESDQLGMRVSVTEGDQGFSRLRDEYEHEIADQDGEQGEKAQPKDPAEVDRSRDTILRFGRGGSRLRGRRDAAHVRFSTVCAAREQGRRREAYCGQAWRRDDAPASSPECT